MRDHFDDVTLAGDGFVLRPVELSDADAIVDGASDPQTLQWLPLPRPYEREHAVEWINNHTAPPAFPRVIGVGSAFAGVIDLKKTDWRGRTTEIGYWLHPAFRGRGLMADAVRLLGDWALRTQEMERVEIRVATGNVASQRVARSAGYVQEGTLRNAGFLHEGRVDLIVFSRIRADLN
ncbi:RimJ/RimL family protein N-acetyltransferase [Branchiibius hedensis]|uniref:Protein N-acetyltransferase, RimJ/RimL family n=1 Tax=Branchiibius hedensis TaxID=672460 RepID=A0A2Y9BTP4_9MICO|nr:GNAT family N-acetyltransferase [Branchiibius hedensis]PWJ25539.1 RimJ/RimL family protein N-acetyltransferase [Branchiibius hedensis]SSA34352.1 Protein N-acetyltransferase, RimJ/RimL family [Branchiibius hedensis]